LTQEAPLELARELVVVLAPVTSQVGSNHCSALRRWLASIASHHRRQNEGRSSVAGMKEGERESGHG
jgi:hypothetical protein